MRYLVFVLILFQGCLYAQSDTIWFDRIAQDTGFCYYENHRLIHTNTVYYSKFFDGSDSLVLGLLEKNKSNQYNCAGFILFVYEKEYPIFSGIHPKRFVDLTTFKKDFVVIKANGKFYRLSIPDCYKKMSIITPAENAPQGFNHDIQLMDELPENLFDNTLTGGNLLLNIIPIDVKIGRTLENLFEQIKSLDSLRPSLKIINVYVALGRADSYFENNYFYWHEKYLGLVDSSVFGADVDFSKKIPYVKRPVSLFYQNKKFVRTIYADLENELKNAIKKE